MRAQRKHIAPIVQKCMRYHRLLDLASVGTSMDFDAASVNWESKKMHRENRSILLHYFIHNMMLGHDVFAVFGGNLLIYSRKHVKLNLCFDYHGAAFTTSLLGKQLDRYIVDGLSTGVII